MFSIPRRKRLGIRWKMAPNEHLLDNFLASTETRNLGAEILRLAQVKTGPGSGHELRELRVGLPAVAILIACERWANVLAQ